MTEETHTEKPPPLQQCVQENNIPIPINTVKAHGLFWGKIISTEIISNDMRQASNSCCILKSRPATLLITDKCASCTYWGVMGRLSAEQGIL